MAFENISILYEISAFIIICIYVDYDNPYIHLNKLRQTREYKTRGYLLKEAIGRKRENLKSCLSAHLQSL